MSLTSQFQSAHAALTTDIAHISVTVQGSAYALMTRVQADAMSAIKTGRKLEEDQFFAAAQQAALIGVRCIDLARFCIDLRRTTLAEFLGDHAEVSISDVLTSMAKVAGRVAAEKAVELMLPGGPLLVLAIQSIRDVRDNLEASRLVYRGRGPEDDMFELCRALTEQVAMYDRIREAIRADIQFLQLGHANAASSPPA